MSTNFQIRNIPEWRTSGRPKGDLWPKVTKAIKAHPGRSVYVLANGRTPAQIRVNGRSCIRNYMTDAERLKLCSCIDEKGCYFWLEK
jgi:hypothetical protein